MNNQWHNAQVAALVDIGVNPLDAERSVSWAIKAAPVDADPATWIPTAHDVSLPVDQAALMDARIAWYTDKPAKVKRLLDARTVD
jgi:hypothetical protein